MPSWSFFPRSVLVKTTPGNNCLQTSMLACFSLCKENSFFHFCGEISWYGIPIASKTPSKNPAFFPKVNVLATPCFGMEWTCSKQHTQQSSFFSRQNEISPARSMGNTSQVLSSQTTANPPLVPGSIPIQHFTTAPCRFPPKRWTNASLCQRAFPRRGGKGNCCPNGTILKSHILQCL